MTDLADFLRARYAEDAQAVRANWNRDGITSERYHGTPIDPTRLLADLDAKLAIVDAYLPPDADVHPGLPCINFKGQDPADYSEYDSCSRHLEAAPRLLRSDHVLRLLARPFAGHPDYRDEWRPTPSSRPIVDETGAKL